MEKNSVVTAEAVVVPKVINIDEFDRILAKNKLAKEMEEEHTLSEDMFHNYLCDLIPVDDELVDGILKSDRSVKGAIDYCTLKAQEQAGSRAKRAIVSDNEVYQWVREYFILDKIKLPNQSIGRMEHSSTIGKTKKSQKTNNKPEPKKEKEQETVSTGQMDIFEIFETEEVL